VATATGTPNSVIQVNDNSISNEQVALIQVNTSLTIKAATKGLLWGATGANSINLDIANTMVSPLTILNFGLTNTGTAANRLIRYNPGVGSNLYLGNLAITVTGDGTSAGKILVNGVLTSVNQFILDNSNLYSNCPGSTVINFNALDITADSALIRNLLAISTTVSGTAINTQTTVSGNNIVDVFSSTIVGYNPNIGSTNGGAISLKNCLSFTTGIWNGPAPGDTLAHVADQQFNASNTFVRISTPVSSGHTDLFCDMQNTGTVQGVGIIKTADGSVTYTLAAGCGTIAHVGICDIAGNGPISCAGDSTAGVTTNVVNITLRTRP
jgi:hypothetical protein